MSDDLEKETKGRVIPFQKVRQNPHTKHRHCCPVCRDRVPHQGGESCACEACHTLTYLLNSYLFFEEDKRPAEDTVEAIWNLHFTKMQIKQLLKQLPKELQPDLIETLHKLQRQLADLTQSLTEIRNENPLSLLLAVIAKDTELMLLSQKSRWWERLHDT